MLTSPFPAHGDRRSADRVFGATVGAPRLARAFVRSRLAEWELSLLADSAELVVSELVTNAITATNAVPTPPMASSMFPVALRMIAVRLWLSPVSLFVEVWDISEETPVAREKPADDLGEGGRGLALIGALSLGWGHKLAPDRGKIVWCELALPDGSAPRIDLLPQQRVPLPRRVRRHPPAQRAKGPGEDMLLAVLDGLRGLD
jgi:hypothetical protein